MQTELTACIIVAVLAAAIAIISAICKHKKTFFIILLVALYFAGRAGIIYLALDYSAPENKATLDIDGPELEPIHFEYTFPKITYYNTGNYGYGLDFLGRVKKDISDTNDEIINDIKHDAKRFLNSITSLPDSGNEAPTPAPVPELPEVEKPKETMEPEEVVATPEPKQEENQGEEDSKDESNKEPSVDESQDISETNKVADEGTGEVENNNDGDESDGD